MYCKCGALWEHELTPEGPHYAKRVCPRCGRFGGWVPKPKNEDKRRDNNKKWRHIWEERGYRCGFCGATKEDFPSSGQWQVDHIIQIEAGGPDEFENTMMICIFCHTIKGIEQKRRAALTKQREETPKEAEVPW